MDISVYQFLGLHMQIHMEYVFQQSLNLNLNMG